jgi:chromosome segregation ATPase
MDNAQQSSGETPDLTQRLAKASAMMRSSDKHMWIAPADSLAHRRSCQDPDHFGCNKLQGVEAMEEAAGEIDRLRSALAAAEERARQISDGEVAHEGWYASQRVADAAADSMRHACRAHRERIAGLESALAAAQAERDAALAAYADGVQRTTAAALEYCAERERIEARADALQAERDITIVQAGAAEIARGLEEKRAEAAEAQRDLNLAALVEAVDDKQAAEARADALQADRDKWERETLAAEQRLLEKAKTIGALNVRADAAERLAADRLDTIQNSTLLIEAAERALRELSRRIVAIRDAAAKPDRSFDLQWQLGRFIDDIENAAGLRSSQLDALAAPVASKAAQYRRDCEDAASLGSSDARDECVRQGWLHPGAVAPTEGKP